ncbi:MAG: hypothetical protein IPL35_00040 [Sphingobacteriales bacterium]|nr:hypothetical protein [Sphingobacteriales bacterium]
MNLKLLIIRCCWVLLLYCFPLINYAQTDCVCAEIYAPVCAAGVTYGNACEAECNGVFDYVDGVCDAVVDSINIGGVDIPPFDSIFIGVPDTLFIPPRWRRQYHFYSGR